MARATSARWSRRGTDAGRDQLDFLRQRAPEHLDLERRTDEPAQPARDGEFRNPPDLRSDIRHGADAREVRRVETREHRHSQHERHGTAERARGFLCRPLRGPHHGRATARVHREHPHVELHRGLDGFGDGGRDVVKLEVEKDLASRRANPPHNIRPFRGEKFLADLERADRRREFGRELERRASVRHVQRDDDGIVHRRD